MNEVNAFFAFIEERRNFIEKVMETSSCISKQKVAPFFSYLKSNKYVNSTSGRF